jgi:hypothetical protein
MSEFPELKSYQKRITTSSYKLPPILSFQSYQDQKTCESRLQTFRFERGNMKKRQIPKKLFSKSLVLDQHFQFHIIDEELKIFFEKLKTLKSKLTLVKLIRNPTPIFLKQFLSRINRFLIRNLKRL